VFQRVELRTFAEVAAAKNVGAGSKTASEYMAKNNAALTQRAGAVIVKSADGAAPAASVLPAVPAKGEVKTAARAAPVAPPAVQKDASAADATRRGPGLLDTATRASLPIHQNRCG
jgi:hypothetical protein